MKMIEISAEALETIKRLSVELTAENERLRDALTTLHARFTQCSKESMSAYEAYDSFYQEVVSDALEARVFPNAPIAPADEN